jgi:peptide deformylase
MSSFASQKYEGIITCDEEGGEILRIPCPPISLEDWHLAKETAEKLLYAREHILGGGAGLAAPQIGINLPVFIYTPDRTAESLRVVINPSYEPVGEVQVEGYEACFSVPLRCTKLKRWERIKVSYQDLAGHRVEEILDGFAAKVFQHEMDHVNGQLTIDHETANVQTFANPESFMDFMKHIHDEDSKRYSA